MSRTRHHRDAISPRRYLLKDWPPRRRALRAIWHLREAVVEFATTAGHRPDGIVASRFA
jgi:hypothetical protein